MIECRQAELDSLFNKYAGEPVAFIPAPVGQGDLTPADEILLDKILRSKQGGKFQKLYCGKWQGAYESHSEADLALCSVLAFWCKKDPAQMDRIFCQSKLYRQKWDDRHGQHTYGQMTIQTAISQTENVYGDGQAPAKKAYSTRGFKLVQAGMIEPKPTQWLIRGLIECDSLALLFGDPNCGKSFFAVNMALCVATGTSFHGHEVKQGSVIYIAGEGHNGLIRRMMAWSHTNRVNYDTAPLFVSQMAAALTNDEMLGQVEAAIELVSAEHGPPVLIVIDTVARNFGPGDENSTRDMGQFIQAADALRAISQASVMLVHHSGHADKGRARGAMALKGALDAEYRLDKDDAGIIRMEATKMKDSKLPEPCAFQLRQIPIPIFDGDGKPEFSAVLESTSYSPPPQKGKAGQGKHQSRALQILKDLQIELRKKFSEEGKDQTTARIRIEEWKKAMKADGIPAQRISEVVSSLQSLRMITGGGGYVSPL